MQVTLRSQRLAVASKKCVLKIAITGDANLREEECARESERERHTQRGDGEFSRVILINHDYAAIMSRAIIVVVHFASASPSFQRSYNHGGDTNPDLRMI